MKRTALILAAAALAAAPAPAAAGRNPATAGQNPATAGQNPATAGQWTARVALTSCTTGLSAGERTAVYEGRMRRVAGTRRMQMRFALQWRQPGARRWSAIQAPGLGTWVSSDRGVKTYTLKTLRMASEEDE